MFSEADVRIRTAWLHCCNAGANMSCAVQGVSAPPLAHISGRTVICSWMVTLRRMLWSRSRNIILVSVNRRSTISRRFPRARPRGSSILRCPIRNNRLACGWTRLLKLVSPCRSSHESRSGSERRCFVPCLCFGLQERPIDSRKLCAPRAEVTAPESSQLHRLGVPLL